jgi:hypothetical protein
MAAVAIPTTAFGHRGFVGRGALRRAVGRVRSLQKLAGWSRASGLWGRLHRLAVALALAVLVSVESVGEEARR